MAEETEIGKNQLDGEEQSPDSFDFFNLDFDLIINRILEGQVIKFIGFIPKGNNISCKLVVSHYNSVFSLHGNFQEFILFLSNDQVSNGICFPNMFLVKCTKEVFLDNFNYILVCTFFMCFYFYLKMGVRNTYLREV